MAMMLNPSVQARAQAELDAVLGQERLPTFADRARMPYVEALVAEVLRWAPPIPLSAFFYITFSGGQCSLVPLRLQPRARRLKI